MNQRIRELERLLEIEKKKLNCVVTVVIINWGCMTEVREKLLRDNLKLSVTKEYNELISDEGIIILVSPRSQKLDLYGRKVVAIKNLSEGPTPDYIREALF